MTDLNNEVRELNIDELDAVSGGKGSKGQELLGAFIDAVGNLAQGLGASNGVVSALYNAACNIDVNAGATHVT